MTRARSVCRLLASVAIAGALLPHSALAANELRRFALIAGANDGGDQRIRLSYAADDARSFARVLTEMGGLDPQDTVLLEDPSVAALSAAFDRVERMIGASSDGRTEVIFYILRPLR